MQRILVVANKVWELHPLLNAISNPRFQLDTYNPYLPEELHPVWRWSYGDPPRPRALVELDHTSIEVWCIADHMDPEKSHSSSEEKNRIFPGILDYRDADPALVVAFGTASSSPDLDSSANGSVVAGSKIFIHDGHPESDPNPESRWRTPAAGHLLESSLDPSFFNLFEEIREKVEKKMLLASVRPAQPPRLGAAYDYVGLSTVNITDFREYATQDVAAVATARGSGVTDPIRSVETTHGLIRAQSEAPFFFVSGIPNRFGKFEDDMGEKSYAQNYAAGFNAGIAVAHLLPGLDAYFAS